MDDLGLPIAFGKPQQQAREGGEKPARGGPSSRGDRGVVGGGKKKRGRGAAPTESRPTEWPRAENLASQYDAFNGGPTFNGGVKRPHGSHQPRQEESRGRGRGRGRGAPRGRGGHGGPGGYGGPRKQETFHGRYLKESMWEDPWEEIILARQAGTA